MAPERIKIKKIDDPTSRQVTFSKRRRGIFKKAEELSILCDVELALIIFSATGKLSEFSTTSTKEIVERYNMHSENIKIPDQPSLDLNLEDGNNARLHRQVEERNHQLRQMRGEDIEGLTLEELHQLEKTLETGLSRVIERKSEQIMEQINGLRQKVTQKTSNLHPTNDSGPSMLSSQVSNNNEGRHMVNQETLNLHSTNNSGPSLLSTQTSSNSEGRHKLTLPDLNQISNGECLGFDYHIQSVNNIFGWQ